MPLLVAIVLGSVGLWLGLTVWFGRMLNQDETAPVRRLGNILIAGLGAALVVVMLAYGLAWIIRLYRH